MEKTLEKILNSHLHFQKQTISKNHSHEYNGCSSLSAQNIFVQLETMFNQHSEDIESVRTEHSEDIKSVRTDFAENIASLRTDVVSLKLADNINS